MGNIEYSDLLSLVQIDNHYKHGVIVCGTDYSLPALVPQDDPRPEITDKEYHKDRQSGNRNTYKWKVIHRYPSKFLQPSSG